ncbi:NAD-dependent epimerase/dehydratase family protein, partial [Candidatus Saccharibacteria bacterium]|nr:NAD-dependent epimerase/dehydratase family protein [Candidatus Saccharibacteria bacterium]
VRDWIHVKDHCKAVDKVLHEGKIGETYCIGGNNEIANIQLTKKIL